MTEKLREVLLIIACAVLATFAAVGWMRQPEPARASEPMAVTAPAAEAKVAPAAAVQSFAAPARAAVVAPAVAAPAPQVKKRSLAKSALIIGAAAGTGAAIGGIAGGGKGAAIGAISGGAAGVIYDRSTANKQRR